MFRFSILCILGFIFFVGCRQEKPIFEDENGNIRITGELTIEKGDSLVIKPGAEVLIDSGANIIAFGNVFIRGTEEQPIYIKGSNSKAGWGVLRAKGDCANLIIHNAVIENGRLMSYQSKNHFKNVHFKNNQPLVWNDAIARFWYGSVLIENCKVEGINKGEGFLLHNVQEPVIRNCTFIKIPDAVEFIDCKNGEIIGNHFEKMTDDAIDQNSCFNTLIKDNRIFEAKDCGMELGSEKFGSSDSLRVVNNLIVGCGKGIIVKESSFALIENNTFYNNKIGVEVATPADSSRSSQIVMINSVLSGLTNPVVLTGNSKAKVSYCLSEHLLPEGEGNKMHPIEFANVKTADYNIISPVLPTDSFPIIGFKFQKK